MKHFIISVLYHLQSHSAAQNFVILNFSLIENVPNPAGSSFGDVIKTSFRSSSYRGIMDFKNTSNAPDYAFPRQKNIKAENVAIAMHYKLRPSNVAANHSEL